MVTCIIAILLTVLSVGPAMARTGGTDLSRSVEIEAGTVPQDLSRSFYDRILKEFHRGDCRATRAGIGLFVELHAGSPLVPYAEYWSGECAYRQGEYREAIESLDRALGQRPLKPKLAAAAFLKKGLAYAKLGERHRSRHLLELVVIQFPHTLEAIWARQALRR